MVNRCFFLMSKWPSLCCQVHWSTSCWTCREWDAKYMWGVWDSSQVLILTFKFSSVLSRWPHHLMPLNCFSPSLSLHSYPSLLLLYLPLSPSVFTSLSSLYPELRLRLHCLPTPLHISLSTLFPLDDSVPPLLPLSQVSDRPISAPMIAVGVLAWQLSRQWQEPGSARELILPQRLGSSRHDDRQRGRERQREGNKERERR